MARKPIEQDGEDCTLPSVAQVVVMALQAEGVACIFGMPGSHILPVFDALADSGIRFVPAIHENTSAFMAGMYGYLTGKPGVALFTAGPGATNSLTAVAQAYASSLPMVHITGDVPVRARREAFHGTDTPDFLHKTFREVTKWAVRVESPTDVGDILAEAFRLARSGRPGPVHVSLPIDILSQRLPGPFTYQSRTPLQVLPSPAFLDRAVSGLARSKRPVICACRGVLADAAEAKLERLAELLGAPVLCTAYGLGAIRQSHALAVGAFSEFSKNSFAFDLVRRSDFMLLIGLRAGTLMTDLLAGLTSSDQTAFAAFDEPTQAAPTMWKGPVEVCGAGPFLDGLLTHEAELRHPADKQLLASIAEQRLALQVGLSALLEPAAAVRPLHFGAVMKAARDHLATNAIVVSGVGNHHVWARTLLPIRDRTSFIAEAAWGTMGGELGGGIAAKLLHPERQVVIVTGDASLLMVGCDFATAVKEQANIIVIVLNDGHHGIVGEMQRQSFGRAFADAVPAVNFARLAESLGGAGVRVEAPEALPEALRWAFATSAQQPVLVDVLCDSNTPWPNRERLIETARHAAETEKSGS